MKKYLMVLLWVVLFLQNIQASGLEKDFNLLKFSSIPRNISISEPFVIFLKPVTTISKKEYVIESYLNSVPVESVKTANQLWTVYLPAFNIAQAQSIKVNIFVRDSLESDRIKVAQSKAIKEIESINTQISNETNLQIIQKLNLEKQSKQAYIVRLDSDLEKLKIFFKTEDFNFLVSK